MGKFIDLTGQKYGRLTVLYRVENLGKRIRYMCLCDCGNRVVVHSEALRSGNTQSCGCYHRERTAEACAVDIIGKEFGWATPEEIIPGNKNKHRRAICRCRCGNRFDVSVSELMGGKVKSCGCYRKIVLSELHSHDLLGNKYEHFTVEKKIGVNQHREVEWLCHCECGDYFVASSNRIEKGYVLSCGCIRSEPEIIIKKILDDHHIQYTREKTFIGCKYINNLPFDFYLNSYGIAIEYDGEFHYNQYGDFNDLESQQKRDAIKTKYCEENDIILLRIPYWEKDNIESILSDWLFLNDAEEANSSSVDLSA